MSVSHIDDDRHTQTHTITSYYNHRICGDSAPKQPPPSKMKSIKMDCTLIKSPPRIDDDDDDYCRTTNAVHSRVIIVLDMLLFYRNG